MATDLPRRRRRPRRRRWLAPAALILLSVIPVTGGVILLATLAHGARMTQDNARFFASPEPVVVHIVTASLYCLLGPLQFVPALRRRRPGWHRAAGRVLIPAGLMAALAGLWMTLFYPLAPGDDTLLRGVRLVFGTAMAAALVLGWTSIRRRDIARHRAWMIRAYAIAQGAGTQALMGIPWLLVTGHPATGLGKTVTMATAWILNLAVAQAIIRRRVTGRSLARLVHGTRLPRPGLARPVPSVNK